MKVGTQRRWRRRRQDKDKEGRLSVWSTAEGPLKNGSNGPGAMERSLGHFDKNRRVPQGEEDNLNEQSVFGSKESSY